MEIEIKAAGTFQKYIKNKGNKLKINIDKPTKINDILQKIGINSDELDYKPVIIIDKKSYPLDYEINEDKKIIIMNRLSGG